MDSRRRPKKKAKQDHFSMRTHAEKVERWRRAAEREDRSVSQWLERLADAAADAVLGTDE